VVNVGSRIAFELISWVVSNRKWYSRSPSVYCSLHLKKGEQCHTSHSLLSPCCCGTAMLLAGRCAMMPRRCRTLCVKRTCRLIEHQADIGFRRVHPQQQQNSVQDRMNDATTEETSFHSHRSGLIFFSVVCVTTCTVCAICRIQIIVHEKPCHVVRTWDLLQLLAKSTDYIRHFYGDVQL